MWAESRARWTVHIETHQSRVFRTLLAFGLGPEVAKELAQDVWTKLMERHDVSAVELHSVAGLALSQARFLALEALRRQRKSPIESTGQLPDAPSRVRPEHEFANRQSIVKLQLALEQESPLNRQVFELLYETPEVSHLDIASRVGLSLQRVRQIICEVRKRLKNTLEEP